MVTTLLIMLYSTVIKKSLTLTIGITFKERLLFNHYFHVVFIDYLFYD